jgi:hypothetical protein
MKNYKVTLTFVEDLLGTIPKDQEVYKNYIASLAALEDAELAQELETVGKKEEKGWTGFHTLDGKPIIYDYSIKGYFKESCSMLRRCPDTLSAKFTAFKKIIDGLVFVSPRRIPLQLSGPLGVLERPLRCSTPQGERVALARSDTAPAGTKMEFNVQVLDPKVNLKVLREWLDYGSLHGLGQWRNGGFGKFTYKIKEV